MHIFYLDICTTLEDLLQACHLNRVFTDQASFHKLLTHISTLDISQYPTLHDIINSVEDSDTAFELCDSEDNGDENKLDITFLEHISAHVFGIDHIVKIRSRPT